MFKFFVAIDILRRAAKSLIKKDALKSLGVAVAVAGLTAGLADALDVDLDPTKLAEHPNRVIAHAQANLVKAVAKGAGRLAAGEKIDDVLKDGAVDMAAGVAGGVAANHIGEAYGEGNLDPLTHKALHAGLGAGLGALKNPDDLKHAMMTGAFAGAVSEVWAEVFAKDIEDVAHQTVAITDDDDEAKSIMKDWAYRQADMAKLVTVAMAGALGQDVDLAEQVADNALKNNSVLRAIAALLRSAAAKKAGQEGVKKGAKEALKKEAKEKTKDVAKKEAKEEAKRQVKEQVEGEKAPEVKDPASFEKKFDKKAVQDMDDHEFVQNIANRADKINPEKGPLVGQKKHDYAKRLGQRYQDMKGDKKNLQFEERYKDGGEWQKNMGLKDSVKPDVYNKETGQAWDYKFGNAKLGQKQVKNLQKNLPKNEDLTAANIQQVKPNQ